MSEGIPVFPIPFAGGRSVVCEEEGGKSITLQHAVGERFDHGWSFKYIEPLSGIDVTMPLRVTDTSGTSYDVVVYDPSSQEREDSTKQLQNVLDIFSRALTDLVETINCTLDEQQRSKIQVGTIIPGLNEESAQSPRQLVISTTRGRDRIEMSSESMGLEFTFNGRSVPRFPCFEMAADGDIIVSSRDIDMATVVPFGNQINDAIGSWRCTPNAADRKSNRATLHGLDALYREIEEYTVSGMASKDV